MPAAYFYYYTRMNKLGGIEKNDCFSIAIECIKRHLAALFGHVSLEDCLNSAGRIGSRLLFPI